MKTTGSDPVSLMRMHVEALFTRDQHGRLLRVNEEGGAAAPRFFLGRTAEKNLWWYGSDLSRSLETELDRTCSTLPVGLDEGARASDEDLLTVVLSRQQPVKKAWAGPAFLVPARPGISSTAVPLGREGVEQLSPYLESWREDATKDLPMAVALQDGRAVSVCATVRATTEAHEAGVETHPDFRGRGHATETVVAWSMLVRRMGRIPLYSTSWSNHPSRRLARRLGLEQFGSDLHIT